MKKIENECVGCPSEMGCLSSLCPYTNVVHYYCDICGEEDVKLYHFNGQEVCGDCLLEELDIVEGSGW